MIYVLLLAEMVLLLLALNSQKGDILAPSVIVCIVWTFSTLCAIYNIDRWGIQLHVNTVCTILGGILIFVIGSIIASYIPPVKLPYHHRSHTSAINGIKEISVYRPAIYLLIILGIITTVYQYCWLTTTAAGASTWQAMMNSYRNNSSSWNVDAIKKPALLSNLEFLLKASAYVTAYIGTNNLFSGKNKRRNLTLFIPSVLFVIDKILNAGRGDILFLIGGGSLVAYVMMQRKHAWKKQFARKYIKYLVGVAVVVLIFFSLSRSLVGRTDDSDALYYLTRYAGGSIQAFDMYLQEPIVNSTIWGKETFSTLNNLIGTKFNIPKLVYIAHLEFRQKYGMSIGNVYGSFRYYIQDFGYIGMVILTFLSSVFYTRLYRSIKRKSVIEDGFDWLLFFYMFIGPSLFMHSIADFTYSQLFNITSNVKLFLFAWVAKNIIVNFRLVNGFQIVKAGVKVRAKN